MDASSALSISVEKQRLELLSKAVRFISCGKLKRGSQLFMEANHPQQSTDMHNMINECRTLGLLVQARRCLRKADDCLCVGSFEDALQYYDKVPPSGLPTELSFQILHNKGVCLVRLGRYHEAVLCFQQAQAYMPDNSTVLQNLAFGLMMSEDYENALQVFAAVIRNDDIPPTNLLHVLYGSAECRQRLQFGSSLPAYPSAELPVTVAESELSDESIDNSSYNDYPLGVDFDIPLQHTEHHREPLIEPQEATCNGGGDQAKRHEFARTYIPFRRLQYRPSIGESKQTTVEPIPPRAELTERCDHVSKTFVGSPSNILSKKNRDQLRRAVNSYDRSALSSGSTNTGVVNAVVHTLPPRRRTTEPSPGFDVSASQRLTATSTAQQDEECGARSASAAHSTPRGDTTEAVSSTKPSLSTHRRHHSHVVYKKPAPSAINSPRSTTHTEVPHVTHKQSMMLASTVPPMTIPVAPSALPHVGASSKAHRHSTALEIRACTTQANDEAILSVPTEKADTCNSAPPVFISAPRDAILPTPAVSSVPMDHKPARKCHPLSDTAATSDDGAHRLAAAQPTVAHERTTPALMVQLMETVTLASPQLFDTVPQPNQTSAPTETVQTPSSLTNSALASSKPTRAARPLEFDTDAAAAPHAPVYTATSVPQPIKASFVVRHSPEVTSNTGDFTAAALDSLALKVSISRAWDPTPATPEAVRALCLSSNNTSISGLSADSCLNVSTASSNMRGSDSYVPNVSKTSDVSESQQEINRVFESRRYVDEYTYTNLDVMRLRSEQAYNTSGPPINVTQFYPLAALQSPGPFPDDVDVRFREYYLSDTEFRSLLRCSKITWDSIPAWRQRNLKKSLKLF